LESRILHQPDRADTITYIHSVIGEQIEGWGGFGDAQSDWSDEGVSGITQLLHGDMKNRLKYSLTLDDSARAGRHATITII